MGNVVKLDLSRDKYRSFYYSYDSLSIYLKNLDRFLEKHDDMNSLCFSKRVMMGMEIQSNNSIEGIKDDLSVIDNVIKRIYGEISTFERIRIINLYKGYQYILKNSDINKESLRELYAILSKGLLDEYSIKNMGKYYRREPVYIMGNTFCDFKKAVDADKVAYYMDDFFDFVHDANDFNSIDTFLKSQIMHLYFVFVHPYFDVNGRTARTVSMWYLLNHQEYAFVIFNRAISYYRQKYIEYVGMGIDNGDITNFLKYMLVVVLKELEREFIVSDISNNSGIKLRDVEEQMLEYFFMIPGEVNLRKLGALYYHYNPRMRFNDIYHDRILSLIDKGILVKDGGYGKDMLLYLNEDYVNVDSKEFQYLNFNKKIRKPVI